MNGFKSWVGTLTTVVIVGLVASIAILVANQHQGLGEIIKTRPVAILVGTAFVCLLTGALMFWRWIDSDIERDDSRQEREFDVVKITVITTIAMIVGWYLVGAASAFADKELQAVAVRTATGWAMAYFAGAFLVGFLFGIPKVGEDGGNQQGGGKNNGGTGNQAAGMPSVPYELKVNTNLEQISDWLTKIIVGLGLVELRKVPDYIHRASMWMATSINNKTNGTLEQSASFCCAFIVFFSVTGFLAGYLLTRLFLAGAFRRAETRQTITDRKVTTSAGTSDNDSQMIRAYWKPDDKMNSKANEEIMAWLQERGLDVSVPLFIRDTDYAKERAALVREVVQKVPPTK